MKKRSGSFLSVMVVATAVLQTSCSQTSTGELPIETSRDMGDHAWAESLYEIVWDSSAVVVGRYVDVADLGSEVLSTAVPTVVNSITEEEVAVPLVGTDIMIDQLLKSDGEIEEDEELRYTHYGSLPTNATEAAIYATEHFPFAWPTDTEFVLFLDKEIGETDYYIPHGPCGRLLTSSEQITCSDGDRTVLSFMEGMNRGELIDAVSTIVAGATPTSAPTFTPTPTITPTLAPTATPTCLPGLPGTCQ